MRIRLLKNWRKLKGLRGSKGPRGYAWLPTKLDNGTIIWLESYRRVGKDYRAWHSPERRRAGRPFDLKLTARRSLD